ncbi:MAG: hypothetical protein ACE5JG_04565, partial [Planctomycetota bacterium]
MIEHSVLASLDDAPASGATLLERLHAAQPEQLRGRRAAVYSALARLHAEGRIAVLAEGPGERVFGRPGTDAPAPRPPGPPRTFGLDAAPLGRVDRALMRITRDLPSCFFQELRRAVVADADRRILGGAAPRRAVREALADLGPPAAVRRVLQGAARGRRWRCGGRRGCAGPWWPVPWSPSWCCACWWWGSSRCPATPWRPPSSPPTRGGTRAAS